MNWRLAHHADPTACRLADLHYSRKTIGAPQMMPPGRKIVLVTETGDAVFGVSWPYPELVAHDWPGAWICTIFRREPECSHLASDLIREAIAVCRWRWPEVPDFGLITWVNAGKVRHKRDPGRCFLKAGFKRVADSRGGLVTLQLLPADMPPAQSPLGVTIPMEWVA